MSKRRSRKNAEETAEVVGGGATAEPEGSDESREEAVEELGEALEALSDGDAASDRVVTHAREDRAAGASRQERVRDGSVREPACAEEQREPRLVEVVGELDAGDGGLVGAYV